MPPKLSIYIPQLVQPLKLWKRDFGFDPLSPVFSKLFLNYRPHDTSSIGLERSLFSFLGLAHTRELPVAKYRYLAHQKVAECDQMLICADPVHCEVGMKDISLTQAIDDLDREEALELISSLNQHFSEDGLKFILDDALHWYLSLPQQEPFNSSVPDEVMGKNIFSYLPRSESRNWQKIQNEVQMLLHMSSLNQSREIAGLSTINSLWFWGGGADFIAKNQVNIVFGGAAKGKTMASVANCDWKNLAGQGTDIIEVASNENDGFEAVVILDQLIRYALTDDLTNWQRQVNLIEEQYIQPLLQAWQQGLIELTIDTCSGQKITPLPASAWKFWKKKTGVSLLSLA